MHRHHKVPKHAGGTDDPENIELLTIQEHAEAHKKLFEEHGRWQDKFAWGLLSGLEQVDEARKLAAKIARDELRQDPEWVKMVKQKRSEGVQRHYDEGGIPWNKGQKCPIISENVKRQAKEGNFHCIGDYQRGRTSDEKHCAKLKERAQAREKKTCPQCGGIFSPAMFTRWHGEKCRK